MKLHYFGEKKYFAIFLHSKLVTFKIGENRKEETVCSYVLCGTLEEIKD